MPARKIIFFLCFILVAAASMPAQISVGKRDSINKKIRSSPDTLKVLILCKLSRLLVGNSPDSALILADSAFKIAERNKYQHGLAQSYANIGSAQNTIGKYDIAIKNFISAAELFEKLKNRTGLSNVLNSIGNAYLGIKNNNKAYEYYLKAYDIANQQPVNENMVAVTSFGIGSILVEQHKSAEAINYFKRAEASFRKQNILNYAAMAVSMIGETYFNDSNYVEAEKNYLQVIPIFREMQDDYGLATSLANMGAIEIERKNYTKASEYYKEALAINFKRNAYANILTNAKALSELMELQNKPADALKYYKTYTQYNDSVLNIERNKAFLDAETKYESEKKEQQLKLKNLELEKSQIQSSQRGKLVYIFAGAMLIFVVLLFFVYKQFSEKKKANVLLTNKNEEIEKQKSIIEEKNKDITDSINYSKHIQQAIIPSTIKVKSTLAESLIFFKPKDIVSGDFYFVERLNNSVYIAAIDCTGHGVPGAMLSVFAYSNIKNIISTGNYRTNPAGILTELCKQFKSNLQSHAIQINDGVDMSICILNEETNKIYYSGAKNNMLHIGKEGLKEYRAERWGVSGANEEKQTVFTNHEIEAKVGEKYFLFTDGFADQFGGPRGKKFKLKQLEELLLSTHDMPFEEQSYMLSKTFIDWKGNLEQIDDVTIIGFGI
ncbi:MAG: tetratricopeptide repeat protein [Bacteroidota bacterium]|nr:tetratricopeptide repeat protein [Bacteroidota bacterium]